MPRDRIWDGDAELSGEAAALRQKQWTETISLEDFYAFMPTHQYIFAPTRGLWPAASVNARIPPVMDTDRNDDPVLKDGKPVTVPASAWLDRIRPVEQMTWAPGLPQVIEDRLIFEGGWIERPGVRCFNLYFPPRIAPGDPAQAGLWLEHVRRMFPGEAENILDWLAHRVQRPHEKINHALVLGGAQGIGKDTLLEPVKRAVGAWNFQEASPTQILGRFNGFLKSVILRISEARDLGDFDRRKFYDHTKSYIAAPPDVLRVDEKHLREYLIVNCCGVIITTNHKNDGLYLDPDDRRHYVAWSELTKEDFDGAHWQRLWGYFEDGGLDHAGAWLRGRDLSAFNPKEPPPKTAAFWQIVDAGRPGEEAELSDLLDHIGNPQVVTLAHIHAAAEGDFGDWIRDRKNRRVIPHRLERCGYTPVRNPDAQDGLWKIFDRRQVVYARAELAVRDRIAAAKLLGASAPVSVVSEVSDPPFSSTTAFEPTLRSFAKGARA